MKSLTHAFVVLITKQSMVDNQIVTAGCCLQIFDDVPPGAHWHCVRTVNMQPRLQVHCFAIDHKYTHTPYDGVHLWNGLHIVTATDDGMHLWDMGSGLLPLRPPLVFSKELAIRGSQVLAVLG